MHAEKLLHGSAPRFHAPRRQGCVHQLRNAAAGRLARGWVELTAVANSHTDVQAHSVRGAEAAAALPAAPQRRRSCMSEDLQLLP